MIDQKEILSRTWEIREERTIRNYTEILSGILKRNKWEMNICNDRDIDDLLGILSQFLREIGKPVSELDEYVEKRQLFFEKRAKVLRDIENKFGLKIDERTVRNMNDITVIMFEYINNVP